MNYLLSYRSLLPLSRKAERLMAPMLFIAALLPALLFSPAMRAQDDYTDTTVAVEPSPVVEEKPIAHTKKTYIPEPFVFRQVPDSIARKLKKQQDFAYANDSGYWAGDPPPEQQKDFRDGFYRFFQNTSIRTIAYSVLIAFFLFVIYRIIVVNKLFLFYSSKKVKPETADEAINIHDDNLDEKIIKAVDEKEYRTAVRYMYLKVLQLLNEKQWIHFHAEATNYEYVNQMRGRRLSNEFHFLTRVYDYVWYGEFALTDEQFEIVNNNFRHFYNAVNS